MQKTPLDWLKWFGCEKRKQKIRLKNGNEKNDNSDQFGFTKLIRDNLWQKEKKIGKVIQKALAGGRPVHDARKRVDIRGRREKKKKERLNQIRYFSTSKNPENHTIWKSAKKSPRPLFCFDSFHGFDRFFWPFRTFKKTHFFDVCSRDEFQTRFQLLIIGY